MTDISAPVLPDHVKKPNEEEYKKSLEQVNASIEKIQKQFVNSYYRKKKKYTIKLISFFFKNHHHLRMLLERKSLNCLPRAITLVVRKSRLN